MCSGDYDSDGQLTVSVLHSLDPSPRGAFTPRGAISVRSLRSGGSATYQPTGALSSAELAQLKVSDAPHVCADIYRGPMCLCCYPFVGPNWERAVMSVKPVKRCGRRWKAIVDGRYMSILMPLARV